MSKRRKADCHPDVWQHAKGKCKSCYLRDRYRDSEKVRVEKKDRSSRDRYLRVYGLSPEDREAMWVAQRGSCANPGCDFTAALDANESYKRLVVDHDHATGEVRGLLCDACNLALGKLQDSVARLSGLIMYLERTQANEPD